MTDVHVQEPKNDRFARLAEPHRRALRLHCYRMVGSLHEAEDLVQETYLRAWRGYGRFEGGSMRAWLYRIATNASLDALESRRSARRVLPGDDGDPTIGMPTGGPSLETPWVEPFPTSDLDEIADDAPSPEARYALRESVRLAFIAAIQRLPPRQRAALLLVDVLGWPAASAAETLGGSTASLNSALQRARETLAKPAPRAFALSAEVERRLLDRYVRAWESHDLDGFVALLKEDATFSMPPWRQWYSGRAAIRDFFAIAWTQCRGLRLLATEANGQPALAIYEVGQDGRFAAHSLHVLDLEGEGVAALTTFLAPTGPTLFASFGLADSLQAGAAAH
jgi:RNA polymerase sigma-70 factor (ECF subfamily)